MRSTTTTVATPVTESNETGGATQPQPTSKRVLPALVDIGKVYGDLTGRFPIKSSRCHQYMLTLYEYDSNTISTEPMKNRTDKETIRAYTALHQQLLNAGIKPELQIMDNEFSNAFPQYMMDQNIALQLVPPPSTPAKYRGASHPNIQKSFCSRSMFSRQTVSYALVVGTLVKIHAYS
jgi:hypothetical protein